MRNSIPVNKYKQYLSRGKAISFPFKSVCYMCMFVYLHVDIYVYIYFCTVRMCLVYKDCVESPGIGF